MVSMLRVFYYDWAYKAKPEIRDAGRKTSYGWNVLVAFEQWVLCIIALKDTK